MCNIREHAVLTDNLGIEFRRQPWDDFMPANDLAWVGFSVKPIGRCLCSRLARADACGNTINRQQWSDLPDHRCRRQTN